MKNPNMARVRDTTTAFLNNLSRFREGMEAERLTMSDQAFMQKYSIGYMVLMKYMGPVDKPYVPRPDKVILDPVLVNIMRWTMPDTDIRDHFHTTTENLTKQCGKRSEHGISGVMKKRCPMDRVSIDKMIEKKKKKAGYIEVKELKTDNWVYPEPTDYEKSWKAEAVDLNRPHPSIYNHIK